MERLPLFWTASRLHPISFSEFLEAHAQRSGDEKVFRYFREIELNQNSEHFHSKLNELFRVYIRLGGLPRLVDAYLDPVVGEPSIPELVKDLAVSIEENVKSILREKSKLYEYEDILRNLALFSMDTLKISKLQVQHAGRREVQKLLSKTTGARVAHKIRRFGSERDLSKYILFDCGMTNYLLNGSDLLRSTCSSQHLAILMETYVGAELLSQMVTRDDLQYWKSENIAEVEFLTRTSRLVGFDVKAGSGKSRSLNSLAILEPDVSCLVKVADQPPVLYPDYEARLPNHPGKRKVPWVTIPHYLIPRIFELIDGV